MLVSRTYLVGFLEGEGSISPRFTTKHRSPTVKVSVYNTNQTVLNLFRRHFRCGKVVVREKGKWNRKTSYVWKVPQREVERVLLLILPYSVIKRKQIRIALQIERLRFNNSGAVIPLRRLKKLKLLAKRLSKLNRGET